MGGSGGVTGGELIEAGGGGKRDKSVARAGDDFARPGSFLFLCTDYSILFGMLQRATLGRSSAALRGCTCSHLTRFYSEQVSRLLLSISTRTNPSGHPLQLSPARALASLFPLKIHLHTAGRRLRPSLRRPRSLPPSTSLHNLDLDLDLDKSPLPRPPPTSSPSASKPIPHRLGSSNVRRPPHSNPPPIRRVEIARRRYGNL
jgi:hypothetical protein